MISKTKKKFLSLLMSEKFKKIRAFQMEIIDDKATAEMIQSRDELRLKKLSLE